MGILTPDHSKGSKVAQANLTRYHHPFRSPMQSEKINLEMQQLKYDLYRLDKKLNDVSSSVDALIDDIFSGCSIDYKYNDEANNLDVEGIEDIFERLNNIERRIRILEEGQ